MARALAYARRGWSIFPCKRGDKRPLDRLVPHGLNDSTTDEATIAEWWTTAEPEANIGIDTGRSGLFVVDIDRQHDGPAAWAALTANRGAPRTATVLTPNRGTHLYFKRPVGVHVGIDHGKRLGPGIDIRGIGGYVVAAGSERPEGAYRWGESSIVANAPQWLLDLVTADPKPFPTSDVPAGGCIPEGQRNGRLTSLGGSMRRRGTSQTAIEAALQAENAERCSPPLPYEEVRAIASSVARYAPGKAPPAAETRPADHSLVLPFRTAAVLASEQRLLLTGTSLGSSRRE